jgi:hypothetical protein
MLTVSEPGMESVAALEGEAGKIPAARESQVKAAKKNAKRF